MKDFEYKLYDKNWNFIDNILDIISEFSFSSNIDWWQGDLNIILNKSFIDNTIIKWNFIKVFCYDDNFPNWVLLYTWMVNLVKRIIETWLEQIQITTIWLWSLLNFVYYTNSWLYSFNKNTTISNIIKDIIDSVNSKFNWFSYDNTSIEETFYNVNISFNYNYWLDSIKKVITKDFNFFINANWKVFLKNKNSLTFLHLLTIWSDIENLEIEENSEKIINKYILEYSTWVLAPVEDIASQNIYWVRELKETKTELLNSNSALIYANNFLAKNKDFTKKIKVKVNSNYILENLQILDLVTINNIEYDLINLQIQKIEYNIYDINLYLSWYNSLSKEIFNI